MLPSTSLDPDFNERSIALTPMENPGVWIHPEDLDPMPQCIAQQDQSLWLDAMTRCTSSRCTRHFLFICTHKQWLTQLSCLGSALSPDLVKNYLPQCSRSVLAKIQLKNWIERITGRTWLVEVGDAENLLPLSPAFLSDGYTSVDVLRNAPTCLMSAASASSTEAFGDITASCGFSSFAKHTGNVVRPWEYDQSLRSMIALGYEGVGFSELTGHDIQYGDYFDKQCFCGAFGLDRGDEACSAPGSIQLTRERLWMNATCGAASLWGNWEDALRTTDFAFIPIQDWQWPKLTSDMPHYLTEPTHKCGTNACKVDPKGYCNKVVPSISRACFCHAIHYESCGDACQNFENRINYVNWLHGLCMDVQDWHGLPDNWRELAEPTLLELIPWRWTLKPSNNTSLESTTHVTPIMTGDTCASTEWKLGSLALVNIAPLLAVLFAPETRISQPVRRYLWHPRPWYCTGILITALQLFAIGINGVLVQNSPGYEDIPVAQLILLWCTIPRVTSLITLLLGVKSLETVSFSAVAPPLFAETILQGASSYYMSMTFDYGREHNFYWAFMERLESRPSAKLMYAGAYLWHAVALVTIAALLGMLYRHWSWVQNSKLYRLVGNPQALEEAPLMVNQHVDGTLYGAVLIELRRDPVPTRALKHLYAVSITSMLLLWCFQWSFWIGFIGLALDEYVI